MSLFDDIQSYRPVNEQEEHDKEQMLQYMKHNANYLNRENQIAHFTASEVMRTESRIYVRWHCESCRKKPVLKTLP